MASFAFCFRISSIDELHRCSFPWPACVSGWSPKVGKIGIPVVTENDFRWLCKNSEFSHIPFMVCGWAFSLTWPASMQIYWNKWKYLHKKKVHVPQDCLRTLTWPPFHCFGTPIWPLWRHVKTPYRVLYRALGIFPNSARSHWLLRGYITSNNETVSRQNLWASNIEKSTATCKRTQHSRAKSLTDFKLCATTPNNAQQHDDRVCKRTQHVTSNNVASICTGVTVHCYPQMLTDDCRYSEV